MKSFLLPVALCAALLSVEASATAFTTVDFSSAYNDNSAGRTGTPTGLQTFGGVTFDIKVVGGKNAYASDGVSANGPTDLHLSNLNIFGATSVYTLLNTFWGVAGQSHGYVLMTGTNGATYQYNLTAGANIRDYAAFTSYTRSLTDPSAQQVYGSSLIAFRGTKVDMQTIALPSSFATETLTDITIHSDNSQGNWGLYLQGVTVASNPVAVPEPASIALFGLGLAGLTVFRRRKEAGSKA